MKILVTGTDGYLGCLLAPELLRDGHEVRGVDTGFYKSGWLYSGVDATVQTLAKDIRRLTPADLEGADAVVHMAELSNDPLGQLSPRITYEINHEGSVRLAQLAKRAGVDRFVYMSSCSVYGVADGEVDETSPVNPQTAYAECKTLVERDLLAMASDTFAPTFLRNATAFGASPRMRFDIVLNNLAGLAWTEQKIAMISDGTPWRPLVHGLDIAKAIRCVLAAPVELVAGEVYNVGSSEQNYRVREIAEIVGAEFPGCQVSFGASGGDNRSYRVSFDKINNKLPGFSCDWDAVAGARQLHSGVPPDRPGRGHLHRPRPYPAAAAAAPDHHRSGGRRALSGGSCDHLPYPHRRRGHHRARAALRRPRLLRPHLLRGRVRRGRPGDHRRAVPTSPSTTEPARVRGMHYQVAPHPEAKLVRCTAGAVVDIIVDMRPDSPTRLQHVKVELSATNRRALYVPPYFAHGYQTLVDGAEVTYQVGGAYAPEAERGLRWDDPQLGLDWPLPVSTISAKDASWPLLAERRLLSELAQPAGVPA